MLAMDMPAAEVVPYKCTPRPRQMPDGTTHALRWFELHSVSCKPYQTQANVAWNLERISPGWGSVSSGDARP